MSREGRRGPMDRFHRRLLWPIRVSSGEVIGFGARRLFDDDPMEAKYVNTPETVLYKKSNVLFGLDLAKRDIAKGHQAVVVEGYTDVMAMHLAGVTTAVASCGTAFGDEHLSMLRRLMMDDNFFRGELIYVFDGDAAGRAAAVKAFEGEQNLAGQSFVAVADRRHGPVRPAAEVRRRCAARPGGAANPVVRVRDSHRAGRARPGQRRGPGGGAAPLRADGGQDQGPDAARRVRPPVGRLGRLGRRRPGDRPGPRGGHAADTAAAETPAGRPPQGGDTPARRGAGAQRPDPRDPTLWPQREALKSALQYPALAGPVFDTLTVESFTHPGYAAVRAGDRRGRRDSRRGCPGAQWIETGARAGRRRRRRPTWSASSGSRPSASTTTSKLPRYIGGVLARLQEVWVGRQIAEVKSKLQRMSPVEQGDEYHALFGDLVAMEAYRRSLLQQASGDDLTA